ncbi:MAG: hypothetical protein ACM3OB_11075 [Acidobacteriota bacterium]
MLDETHGNLDYRAPEAHRADDPPAEMDRLLAALPAPCQALYRVVRAAVDEIEDAVSWQLLYYPPDEIDLLAAALRRLAASIRRLPERLAPCLEQFPSEESRALAEPVRDEVEFYFRSVTHMVDKDLARLDEKLDQLAGRASPPPEEVERLCELAADLKGKFSSAAMSATAALVAQGRWESLAVEPALFPEKAAEFRRSRELLAALRALFDLLRELPERVPLGAIIERWRYGQRVDQYAFADLVVLRGHLGSLLREPVRRALYSGDYHQIRQREVHLAERITELESIHRRSWSAAGPDAAALLSAELPRLEQLLSEIAALTDAQQLKALIGERAVARLRGRIGSQDGAAEPLVGLLAHDDLRLFVEMLVGAVQRRAALAADRADRADHIAEARNPVPVPPLAVPGPVSAPRLAASPSPAARSPSEQATELVALRNSLRALHGPQNPRWNNFRMVLRMFARHGRLPDAMVGASLPFVEEFLTTVAPTLRRLAPYGGLTVELVERIEGTCRALIASPTGSSSGTDPAARSRLERLERFLEALETVISSG